MQDNMQENLQDPINYQNEPQHSGNTGLIAGIALIAILLLVGLYFYGSNTARENNQIEVEVDGPSIESTQSGDEVEDIQADFEEFSPEELDTNDADVEAALETGLEY